MINNFQRKEAIVEKNNTNFVKEIKQNQAYVMPFPNLGVVFSRIDKKIYKKLLKESIRLRKENSDAKDFRHRLAGNLSHEYDLIQKADLLEPTIQELLNIYEAEHSFLKNVVVNFESSNLKINSLWVNFMERNDFNPPHCHTGVFSFVIWMKIPYDLQKELKIYPKTNTKNASKFSFIYSNILGRQGTFDVDVDKDYEGVICLFPSQLYHCVNPFFTTKETRISIAGNICFDNSKK